MKILTISLAVIASVVSTADVANATQPIEPNVAKAARDYRIETFNRFHAYRAEYGRRIALGRELLKRTDNGLPVEDALAWYASARHANFSYAALPLLPNVPVAPTPVPVEQYVMTDEDIFGRPDASGLVDPNAVEAPSKSRFLRAIGRAFVDGLPGRTELPVSTQ